MQEDPLEGQKCRLIEVNPATIPLLPIGLKATNESLLASRANRSPKPGVCGRFADMLIFDALIYNEDRHFGNFGLMVDNHTNQPCGFAPLFDHGLSLFNYAMPDDIVRLDAYVKTRSSAYGVPFENIAREFMTPRQKKKLRSMLSFRFTRNTRYHWPAARLKAIEEHLQKRAQFLLSLKA